MKYYTDIHGKTRRDVCAALDINYFTLSDWVNAKKYPWIDKIEKPAAYFGIDVSDLINEHIEPGQEDIPASCGRATKTARLQENMTVSQLAEHIGATPQL